MNLLFTAFCLASPFGQAASGKRETAVSMIELTGAFLVGTVEDVEKPQVSFPLPRRYRGQVPVSFNIAVKPENARVSVRTIPGGCDDRIVELTLAPMKANSKVAVLWRAIVAADRDESFARLPTVAPFPEKFPNEALPWLAPSAYVQSTDRRIKSAARGLKGSDVVETVTKTLAGQQRIVFAQHGPATDLSSVQALDRMGSCTSNANLLAALLRANGVPARILAGYPTWSNGPLQTHYIVEAYVPDFGWYPLEPTLGTAGWKCMEMPIVSIASVDHEDRGEQRGNIVAGVPFLTLNEMPKGVVTWGILRKDGCDHEAKRLGDAVLPPGAWDVQGARWEAWTKATYRTWSDLPSEIALPKAK